MRTRSNDNLHRNDSRPQSPIVSYGNRNDFRRSGRERGNRRNSFGRSRNDTRNDNYNVQEENWDKIDDAAEAPKQMLKSPRVNSATSPPIAEEKDKPALSSNSSTVLVNLLILLFL